MIALSLVSAVGGGGGEGGRCKLCHFLTAFGDLAFRPCRCTTATPPPPPPRLLPLPPLCPTQQRSPSFFPPSVRPSVPPFLFIFPSLPPCYLQFLPVRGVFVDFCQRHELVSSTQQSVFLISVT
ncbi:unnamed protein product [Mesocestoides corti]|uniref:Secreted protein n=1 Tax=Mesocestoides corti TaxID=53468 RepID=A0A0R3UKZ3_MESCO|nr:unnamed protein product [Mesocestoides corti]